MDAAAFRQVMGHFCTGVTIITALDPNGREPVGFTAQAFQSLSMEPPLVLFCPQKTSSTWPRIEAAGSFCVNVLAADQEALCRAFAASGTDKYRGVGWRAGPATGSPVLSGTLAWIEGRITTQFDGGDHLIVVGEVLDMHVEREGKPLLFYRGGFGSFES